ncbi:MAG: hypothetical protein RLZZ292_1514 [Bacteroidota bacterium]|jgi:hypothetical protein
MKKIIFLLLGFSYFTNAQSVVIQGNTSVIIQNGSVVKAVGSVENDGTITANGTLDFTQTLTNNGTLTGSGTVVAGTTWANGATSSIAPGNATTGTLNVTGDFAPSSSILNMEIASRSDFDKFLISGAATLNTATLNVTLLNGFVPSSGDSFTILDAASLTGGFTTTSLPTLGGSISWSIAYNSGNGTATLVASSASVLPIELITFQGKKQKNEVLLTWKTALEQNIRNFDIERSTNGFDFQVIGRSLAKGSNAHYTFIDEHPFQKNNYYRLKMNDLDGTFTYSTIININFVGNQNGIKIYPTIFENEIIIQHDEIEIKNIQIIDAAGKRVQSFKDIGTNTRFDLSSLATGIYFIQIEDSNSELFIGKVVRQ